MIEVVCTVLLEFLVWIDQCHSKILSDPVCYAMLCYASYTMPPGYPTQMSCGPSIRFLKLEETFCKHRIVLNITANAVNLRAIACCRSRPISHVSFVFKQMAVNKLKMKKKPGLHFKDENKRLIQIWLHSLLVLQ